MFGHNPGSCAAKKRLWANEDTPNAATAETRPSPRTSFARATSEIDANNLLQELKARGNSPELTLLQASIDFVSSVINNNVKNIHEKITALIMLLESSKKSEAYTYCVSYCATQLAVCAMQNYHFRQFYDSSELKKYLDTNRPHHQSPQKHAASPLGSPTKG